MEYDEERSQILQKILDLLLAGGYFRARISSLSPFDKLTGGLAWCITASNSNADIDFDVFYDDDATLGDKIKVGEAIEAALQNMACPYPLQAHQIQGLDYQAVYPVVQWLVKRVLAVREELGDELRRFSHLQFENHYKLPAEAASDRALQERVKGLNEALILQRHKRLYQRAKGVTLQNPADHVHCTLLEYGLDINRSVFPPAVEAPPVSSGSTPLQIDTSGKEEDKSASDLLNIKGSLSACADSDDGFLSISRVGQIASLHLEEIQFGISNYTYDNEDHATWKQKAAALIKKIEEQETCVERFQGELSQTQKALETLEQSMKEQDEKSGGLKSEMNHLYQKMEEEGVALITQRLVSLLEALKSLEKQESDFRVYCKQTRAEMLAEIGELTSQLAKSDNSEDNPVELESSFNADLLKLEAVRIELAKKNQAVSLLQRRLDDIPSQTELIQYERRFVELYVHIQAKLRETRRYYGTYNALAEANELTLKEISLLNSINSQFEDAMMAAIGRAKLLESMEGIAKGVQQKLAKMQVRFQTEQSKCTTLKEKYGTTVAKQRHYSTLVKSFQDEYARNERLRTALDSLNSTGS